MRIAIIGIGAMGCLFAARLTPVADVVMIGHWPKQLHVLQQDGLTYIDAAGHAQEMSVQATNNPSNIAPVSIIFVLVKSYQTEQAAKLAAQILDERGLVITLQNGLGNLETLAEAMGANRTILGTTTEGATLEELGVVRHAGHGVTHLARSSTRAAQLAAISERLQAAGFDTRLADDVESILWEKLAVNAAINPLTALLGVNNGFLAENGEARELMLAVATEAARVAQAQNIRLSAKQAGLAALEVAQATSQNQSSMLQDILNQRPTEIEAISGSIVRLGEAHGVPTPLNAALVKLTKARSDGQNWLLMLQELAATNVLELSLLLKLHNRVYYEHL